MLVEGELTVAVLRVGGTIQNIWITDDPRSDVRYSQPDDHIEFRRWNGTKVEV